MDKVNEFVTTQVRDMADVKELLSRLTNIARPEAIYSQPIEVGEQKIITASHVTAGLGFGFGAGGGIDEELEGEGKAYVAQNGHSIVGAGEGEEGIVRPSEASGMGGGGGGGGGATGRPVAVISITPNDVRVVPVIDQTRIGLAVLSTLAAIFLMMTKLRRMSGD